MTFTLEELIAIGRAASRQPDREFAPDELEFIHDVAHLAAEKAAAKEREACAQVAMEFRRGAGDPVCGEVAAAIRARGQKEGV